MKKPLQQTIEIPENVEVNIEENVVVIRGKQGENKRSFNFGKLKFEKRDNQIIIWNEKATKTEKKDMNTIAAHIKNMIRGVQEKFEYKLKICFSHFPISVGIDGNEAVIKNFLGEKIPRKVKIPKGVEVTIDKDIVTVKATDKELAGQTAANFEIATRIKKRDKRVFQDGVFIISKDKKEI